MLGTRGDHSQHKLGLPLVISEGKPWFTPHALCSSPHVLLFFPRRAPFVLYRVNLCQTCPFGFAPHPSIIHSATTRGEENARQDLELTCSLRGGADARSGYANHLHRFRVAWPVLPLGHGFTRAHTSISGTLLVSAKAETNLNFHTAIY